MLCLDVEPDLRRPSPDASHGWAGFERLVADVDRLRKALAQPTGRPAQVGWFLRMDPQVEVVHGAVDWVASRYEEELAALTGAGDELGLHPHSWRWDGSGWCSDQSVTWVAHCAEAGLDAYERAFGSPCRAYRHGDRFTSPALVALLRARGVRCDLGLEPGRPAVAGLDPAEPSMGSIPAVPDDWVQPFAATGPAGAAAGPDDDLLLIPLTSSIDPAPDVPGARFGTLLLGSPPQTFATLFDARLAGGDLRHLAFALRTDVALDGGSLAWVEQNLDHIGSVLGTDLEWVTPTEARRRLLPDVRQALRRDAVWPHSLGVEELRTVTQCAVAALQDAELASVEAQARVDAVTAELEATRDRLAAADADREAQRTLAAARQDRLTAIEGTVTWRLHQRLLPVLRMVRRTPAPADRVELRGVIASSGFASGHRVVVGHWADGPLGAMTDVMWADPDGRRTLVAPSDAVADLITSVYAFDAVEVTDVEVVTGHRRLLVRTGRRELELMAGRGIRLPVPRPAWVTRFVEAPVARALMGVQTYGTSPSGVREWYRADGYRRLASARAALDGVDLGAMAPVDPPCGFGFSEPPRRPSWVEVRPLLEGPVALPTARQ